MKSKQSFYPYVMATFCVVLVLSNIAATKLIPLGSFVFTAGIVIFPISYILGDVITEVYGFAGARRIFWMGLAANILMSFVFWLTGLLTPLNPEFNTMYNSVLGQVPRIVIASLCGIWIGQFANSIVLSRLKVLTDGRYLWVRTISSTLVGETLDSAVFVTIAFLGSVPTHVLFTMIYSMALFKTLYEAAITPLTYIVVNWFKRHEGEVFDRGVSYSPFTGGLSE